MGKVERAGDGINEKSIKHRHITDDCFLKLSHDIVYLDFIVILHVPLMLVDNTRFGLVLYNHTYFYRF